MTIKRFIVFAMAVLALHGCQNAPEVELNVRECAEMPNGGLASACACTLDGKAYVFGGRDGKRHYRNELWVYDPVSDTWTNLGATPLKARVNATMTAADGLLYVGLGYSETRAYRDSAYMKDWWSYSPSTDTWTRLADFPNGNTVAASSYVTDGDIYTIYGFGYGYTHDVYRYNTSEDQWTVYPDNAHRAWLNFGGRGAICNGQLYFGLGYRISNLTQWYEADLQSDTWHKRCSLPGKGREFAACAATNEYVYILGGRYFAGDMTGGEIFDTYLRYSPKDDQWTWCGKMPCGRAENQVAFTLNGKVYFGLGENEESKVSDKLYCIE